ncbi:MAG: hypothetical protein ACPHFO_03035 [Acidimicrobiales bacterium]
MPPHTEAAAALTGPERVEVASPFDGQARGVFAWPDERVRRFQPVLWMAGRAA